MTNSQLHIRDTGETNREKAERYAADILLSPAPLITVHVPVKHSDPQCTEASGHISKSYSKGNGIKSMQKLEEKATEGQGQYIIKVRVLFESASNVATKPNDPALAFVYSTCNTNKWLTITLSCLCQLTMQGFQEIKCKTNINKHTTYNNTGYSSLSISSISLLGFLALGKPRIGHCPVAFLGVNCQTFSAISTLLQHIHLC